MIDSSATGECICFARQYNITYYSSCSSVHMTKLDAPQSTRCVVTVFYSFTQLNSIHQTNSKKMSLNSRRTFGFPITYPPPQHLIIIFPLPNQTKPYNITKPIQNLLCRLMWSSSWESWETTTFSHWNRNFWTNNSNSQRSNFSIVCIDIFFSFFLVIFLWAKRKANHEKWRDWSPSSLQWIDGWMVGSIVSYKVHISSICYAALSFFAHLL